MPTPQADELKDLLTDSAEFRLACERTIEAFHISWGMWQCANESNEDTMKRRISNLKFTIAALREELDKYEEEKLGVQGD